MTFIHDDAEFEDLLRIVARERRISLGLVEKDYWVTHSLWALHEQGFDIWFKGGTSLSKGFGLIERFSEDLDLKIDPGSVPELSPVTNWKSEAANATKARRTFFEKLTSSITIPATTLTLEQVDDSWRSANIQVTYPAKYLGELSGVLRPFVLLEVGCARVTPAVAMPLTSFVHAHLDGIGLASRFDQNTPQSVRCVHPLVTLLEKLDAIHRRALKGSIEPAAFVRHFEDAARVIESLEALPALEDYADVQALAAEMWTQKQLAVIPSANDPAFRPDGGERWNAIGDAHAAIAPMFWGPRISVEDSCSAIRGWLSSWT